MNLRKQRYPPNRYDEDEIQPQRRDPTKPAFPELLAQQIVPFDRSARPAAFPSLPLTGPYRAVQEVIETESICQDEVLEDVSDDLGELTGVECSEFAENEAKNNDDGVRPYVQKMCMSEEVAEMLPDVSWNSLPLSLQCHLVKSLVEQRYCAQSIIDLLRVTEQEFDTVQDAINLRKMYPTSLDEIWQYCAITDGFGASTINPETLDRYMEFMVFASRYDMTDAGEMDCASRFMSMRDLGTIPSSQFIAAMKEGYVSSQSKSLAGLCKEQASLVQSLPTHQSLPDRLSQTPHSCQVLTRRTPDPDASMDTCNRKDHYVGQSRPKLGSSSVVVDQGHAEELLQNTFIIPLRHVRDGLALDPSGLLSMRPRTQDPSLNEIPDIHFSASTMQSLRPTSKSDTLDQLNQDQDQLMKQQLELDINMDTGHAQVVDNVESVMSPDSQDQAHEIHPLHKPAAFAVHFNHKHFPSAERRALLRMSPLKLSESAFWLVYGDAAISKTVMACPKHPSERLQPFWGQLCHEICLPPPFKGAVYNPVAMKLDLTKILHGRLRALIQVHNQWIADGVWERYGHSSALLRHFERVCLLTLKNVVDLEAINAEAKKESSSNYDPTRAKLIPFNPLAEFDVSCPKHVIQHNKAVVASRAIFQKEFDAENASQQSVGSLLPGRSPDRPSISPISNYGDKTPLNLMPPVSSTYSRSGPTSASGSINTAPFRGTVPLPPGLFRRPVPTVSTYQAPLNPYRAGTETDKHRQLGPATSSSSSLLTAAPGSSSTAAAVVATATVPIKRARRKDAGKKRGPYKKTREKKIAQALQQMMEEENEREEEEKDH